MESIMAIFSFGALFGTLFGGCMIGVLNDRDTKNIRHRDNNRADDRVGSLGDDRGIIRTEDRPLSDGDCNKQADRPDRKYSLEEISAVLWNIKLSMTGYEKQCVELAAGVIDKLVEILERGNNEE